MGIFDFHAVCGDFPISGFIVFIVLYTVVCASLIGTWKYALYKRPALDMIASIFCGLLMSLLIILFFTIVKNRNSPFDMKIEPQKIIHDQEEG
ncbi:hypothetical protein [Candidatus Liberibacter sp.]|uniref:hypothetical protein n=1 Tax=Candidatus Liberibacter sp. TaxID=34022 RepID=UPI0015F6BE1A|nr:hypothetical protein [Candidatus Liberibacter sp.]MBA5723870.1 hypothetical protein [Candidatus Liberibacter sp.]